MMRTRPFPRLLRCPHRAGSFEAGEGRPQAALRVRVAGGGLADQRQQARSDGVVAAGPVELGTHARVVLRPLEPGDHLGRAGERRQRGRDALVPVGTPLLGGLDVLPVHGDLVGVAGLGVPEHVRVPADELRHDPGGDVVDAERAFRVLLGHPGVEDDLQQQVAELLTQVVAVARRLQALDRLEHLVGLLEQVRQQGGVRLPGVPGAPAGRAQAVHDRHQVQQARARHVVRGGDQLDLGRGTVDGPPGEDLGEGVREARVAVGRPEPDGRPAAGGGLDEPQGGRGRVRAAEEQGPDAGRAERLEPAVVELRREHRVGGAQALPGLPRQQPRGDPRAGEQEDDAPRAPGHVPRRRQLAAGEGVPCGWPDWSDGAGWPEGVPGRARTPPAPAAASSRTAG